MSNGKGGRISQRKNNKKGTKLHQSQQFDYFGMKNFLSKNTQSADFYIDISVTFNGNQF